ncbi:MAG: hypothetical protein Q8N05_20350 [Bacteroidota bacterium]|nr:hypothetical protein [Bacteroidota bacterium]
MSKLIPRPEGTAYFSPMATPWVNKSKSSLQDGEKAKSESINLWGEFLPIQYVIELKKSASFADILIFLKLG